jgi:hypothetical protein
VGVLAIEQKRSVLALQSQYNFPNDKRDSRTEASYGDQQLSLVRTVSQDLMEFFLQTVNSLMHVYRMRIHSGARCCSYLQLSAHMHHGSDSRRDWQYLALQPVKPKEVCNTFSKNEERVSHEILVD